MNLYVTKEKNAMYELHVEGMTCGGCAAGVRRAIQTIDNQAEINVDLPGKTVRVNTSSPVANVKSAIEGVGFEVTAIKAG